MAQLYPLKRVTNRPTIINPVSHALTPLERQAFGLKMAWESRSVPTTLARTPPAGGRLTSVIAGKRVAGATVLRGGRV